jgi:multidrug transporter EmrE-like cation transporter
MRYWIALILALVLNATANLLMKVGSTGLKTALHNDPRRDVGALAGILVHNWALFLGLFFFATNVLLYTYALQTIKISVAYPIMVAAGFAIIAVVAWRYLNESLSPVQWGGIALILVGVYLVAREVRATAS